MSRFTSHDFLFNKPPLHTIENREENFLIDVIGNWIPEADILYYGLLNSDASTNFYKLQQISRINPKEMYYNLSYYTGEDLIRYLYIKDPIYIPSNIDKDILTDDEISKYTEIALQNYHYLPSNELMIRHAVIEAAYESFVKSITLVYPWPIRKIDLQYLSKIIPQNLFHKINVRTGNLIDILKEEDVKNREINPYTSIITNSLIEVNDIIDNAQIYKTQSAFILLRNHSGNMHINQITKDDGSISYEFIEIGTREILMKILNEQTGIPTTQIRFARYEPLLFEPPTSDIVSPYQI